MNEQYEWRPGAHFRGDAQEIGEALEAIEGKTPEAIVEAAKPRRSPLHKLIYDGTTASEALDRYLLDRARHLLKSLVVITEVESEPVSVPAFHRIVTETGRSWESVADVRDNPEWSAQVDRRLRRELASIKRELDAYNVYQGASEAIGAALELAA